MCKKDETKLYTCVICGVESMQPMSYVDLRRDCPIHEVVMFCGQLEFVCPSCTNEGWYSTAGCGGATQHINEKTGLIKHCLCLEGKSKIDNCIICNVSQKRPLSYVDRKKDCPVHQRMILGRENSQFICESCVDVGYGIPK